MKDALIVAMLAMPYNFRIHIHLGAHKTASTFMQNWLTKHLSLLKRNKIAYIPLENLRRQFSSAFWEMAVNSAESFTPVQLRDMIFTEAEACGFDLASTRLLIVSEENILGSLSSLSTGGVLYPGLSHRLQILAKIFEGYPIQPFFSVRSYLEFYPSAYAETLRDGYIKPFENYLHDLAVTRNSWVDVIETIEESLGPAVVWPYEQFRSNAHLVLSALLRMTITADSIDVNTVVRRSLTQKGLLVAMSCQDALSANEIKKLVNLLADRMKFEEPDEKISIRDSRMINELTEKYAGDLQSLANRLLNLEIGEA